MNEHTVSWLMIDDGWLLVVSLFVVGTEEEERKL